MEWADWIQIGDLEACLVAGNCGCQLQEHNNELQDVDADLTGVKKLTCAVRPHTIKQVFEFMAKCTTTNWAGVAKA